MVLSWELCLCIPPFNSLVFTSIFMDVSLQGLGVICALWTTLGLSLMWQSNLFISSRAHSCPFCSDICSFIILSSKDHPFSLRQHRCPVLKTLNFVLFLSFLQRTLQIVLGNIVVCAFFFISRELPLLGHVFLLWHLFAIIFTRTSLFFHLLMFQGHESLADHLWRSFLTFHIRWSLNSWIFRW